MINPLTWQPIYREDAPLLYDPPPLILYFGGPNGARYPAICEDVTSAVDLLDQHTYVRATARPDPCNAPDPLLVESVFISTEDPFNQYPLVRKIPMNDRVYLNYGDTITVFITLNDSDAIGAHLRGNLTPSTGWYPDTA